MKILVVDDFATMRRIIKNLLNTLGYEDVNEAEDGTVALPMLHNEDYEFLITDLNMPGMSGLDLLRAVRADSTLCRLPVLVVTADANREKIVAAAKAGVDGYMVKPFSAAVLQSKISAILARTGQGPLEAAAADKDETN
ncbi:MAG TPA: response regulator [Spongiibacteraceae bacterium]|nr:response regulator [Spongiibacteraceae bacterium]HCS28703.1 response regulator [Spongiibacteraceae bacterium]|tara:strand:- start:457 stop:873 length:417 start_codon:yes stop_codon:yes gene_type:complete